jgi:predicted membrane-bound spermidine synthase
MILTLKPINAGLFTGGFTLASAEIILIFSLQVLFGNIFLLIGITITLIMAGLTIGSYMSFGQRFLNKRIFIGLQVIMAMFAGLLAFSIYLLDSNQVNEFFSYLIILILSISGSFIAGLEYQSASLLSLENKLSTVSKNYSADMFGASVGILTVTIFIIPMVGIYYTCLLLVCLNLISASYSKIRISL